MKIIERIEINGFRSFWSQSGAFEIKNINDVNIFLGKNDCGKSNILRALNLFFNGETDFKKTLTNSDFNSALKKAKTKKSSDAVMISIKIYFCEDFLSKNKIGGRGGQSYKNIFDQYTGVEKIFYADREEIFMIQGIGDKTRLSDISQVQSREILRVLGRIIFRYIPVNRDSEFVKKFFDTEIKRYLLSAWGSGDAVKISALNKILSGAITELESIVSSGLSGVTDELKLNFPEYEKISLAIPKALEDLFSAFDIEVTSKSSSTGVASRETVNLLDKRGSGVQSKLLFTMLYTMDKAPRTKNGQRHYIWGIEEPEIFLHHSLETSLWDNFADVYSDYVQVFTTSHTIAYPLLLGKSKISPFLLKSNSKDNSTDVLGVDDTLFADTDFKNQVNDQLGIEVDYTDLMTQGHPVIFTEGKTDWKHLALAKDKLGITQDFVIYAYEHEMGDSKLLQMLDVFSRMHNSAPRIFIFDRDVQKVVDRVEIANGVRSWGNNVFSFCIPIPSGRGESISIELYYADEHFMTPDIAGNRMYFSNEIRRNISHTTEKLVDYSLLPEPDAKDELKKYIFSLDKKVPFLNGFGASLSVLSKNDFVENVAKNFPSDAFLEFHKIFDQIAKAIRDA